MIYGMTRSLFEELYGHHGCKIISLDGDSRGYPIVMLSYQRDRNVHVGIIHGNQWDRNSGGEIWSRIDFRDGRKVIRN